MAYINISTAAEKWGITVRRVQELCKNGSIKGATRFGRAWMIPDNAEKPADKRFKGGDFLNFLFNEKTFKIICLFMMIFTMVAILIKTHIMKILLIIFLLLFIIYLTINVLRNIIIKKTKDKK